MSGDRHCLRCGRPAAHEARHCDNCGFPFAPDWSEEATQEIPLVADGQGRIFPPLVRADLRDDPRNAVEGNRRLIVRIENIHAANLHEIVVELSAGGGVQRRRILGRLSYEQARQVSFDAGAVLTEGEGLLRLSFLDSDLDPVMLEGRLPLSVGEGTGPRTLSGHRLPTFHQRDEATELLYQRAGNDETLWSAIPLEHRSNEMDLAAEGLAQGRKPCPACNWLEEPRASQCSHCGHALPSWWRLAPRIDAEALPAEHHQSELLLPGGHRIYLYTKGLVQVGRHRNNDIVMRYEGNSSAHQQKSLFISNLHGEISFQDGSPQWESMKIGRTRIDGRYQRRERLRSRHSIVLAETLELSSRTIRTGGEVEALCLRRVNNLPEEEYCLLARSVAIGRSQECGIVADHPLVDGIHGRFVFWLGRLWLEGLSARRPLTVNGEEVAGLRLLAPGDRIGLGDVTAELRPWDRWRSPVGGQG